MEVQFEQRSVTEVETPFLVVNVFEGMAQPGGATRAVDDAMGGLISRLIHSGEITGESGQVVVIHNPNPGPGLAALRVAVAGLGPQKEFGLEAVRIASASAARRAREVGCRSLATIVHGAGVGGLDPFDAALATLEGAILSQYRYTEFQSQVKPPFDVESITIVERDQGRLKVFREAADLAQLTTGATNLTRDLSNGPSNVVTPAYLAEKAREVAEKYGLEYQVFWKEDLERLGMNGILAVNQGSAEPPCMVVMRYRTSSPDAKTLAVVGKGITFDSGGISIKPAEGMHYMRHDKSGAAAVIGFMQLAASTRLPVNVIGAFAATENMPSGTAYKPGDVIRAYNGKTMEIINTDAEGRVTLSDVLAYMAEQKPDLIVDLATLTGACVVALGNHATGAMGSDEKALDLMRRAGEITGERIWPLPLWKEYARYIKTPIADVKNSGGRRAGAITAAAFLQAFVGDTPWLHLDIAGTAWADEEQVYVPEYNPKRGATGIGPRLLHQFCRLWASQ